MVSSELGPPKLTSSRRDSASEQPSVRSLGSAQRSAIGQLTFPERESASEGRSVRRLGVSSLQDPCQLTSPNIPRWRSVQCIDWSQLTKPRAPKLTSPARLLPCNTPTVPTQGKGSWGHVTLVLSSIGEIP